MTTVIKAAGSLRERKKLASRARIMDVAIKMFAQRGIQAPTVEEIAAAAEVGKGTIYNYFRSKEEIVVAFMVELEERLQAKGRRLARRRGPLASILADFAWTHLRLKEPYREFVRVFMTQVTSTPPALVPHFVEIQRSIDPPLAEFLTSLQQRGLIRQDADPADLVNVFKTLQVGLTAIWLADREPYRGTRRLIQIQMRLFAEGLAPGSRRGRRNV